MLFLLLLLVFQLIDVSNVEGVIDVAVVFAVAVAADVVIDEDVK